MLQVLNDRSDTFFTFSLLHLYSVFIPSVKDMKFAFFIGNVYLISTLIVNYLIDSNYFYTLRKPTGPSLLDFMGCGFCIFYLQNLLR